MMQDQKEILEAYLQDALAAHGMTLAPAVLDALHAHIELAPRPLEEGEEYRSVSQYKDSAGRHSAESFKLMNIAQVDQLSLFKIIGQYVGILMFEETAKKLIYAFSMLLLDFFSLLKTKFSEQEAQIIYAIAQLQKRDFTTQEVAAAYAGLFPQPLPEERIEDSLAILTDCHVLRRTARHTYRLEEKIKELKRKARS